LGVKLSAERSIVVSNDAQEIRRRVNLPLHERTPVSYQREFLDRYQPNKTAYLSEKVRAHLRAVGMDAAASPVAGTRAKKILSRLLIDLSWNSSRLEGNTYSLLETQRLVEVGESTDGKTASETQMILNHKAAIEFVVENAAEIGLDRRTILNLHALLSDNLLSDPEASGRLRAIGVGIEKSVYHPSEVPQVIEECFQKLLNIAAAINDPFEQSFFVMVQLPYLQPFEDVNKRVSRLAANIPLIRHNLCPLSFVDVPTADYLQSLLGVYELNRIEPLRDVFVWAYERSCARYSALRQSIGEPDPLRLRYRSERIEVVGEIIRQRMNKRRALDFIRIWTSDHVRLEDNAKFLEMVETELLALHDGNFSRYRVRPAEFDAWRAVW
jgi:Fic/DOC family